MTDKFKIALIIAVLAAVVGGLFWFRARERELGALQEQNKSLVATNAILTARVHLDSIALAHKDTAVVFRNVVRSDTVLQHIIDSAIVHHHDTVTVTREVLVEAKAALDSTKGVADACCQLARDWKARWAVTDSLYRNTLKLAPSPWVPHFGAGAAAGVNPQGKFDAVAGITLNWKFP